MFFNRINSHIFKFNHESTFKFNCPIVISEINMSIAYGWLTFDLPEIFLEYVLGKSLV